MVRAAALVLAVVCALTGCSEGDPEPVPDEPSAEATPAGDAVLDVPADVSLTPPGTGLEYGESATVAWQVSGGEVGVLDLTVSEVERVRRSRFRGWLQDGAMRRSTPYFVHARLRNRGTTDLGGEHVPLYLLDGNGTLGPPWSFAGDFQACRSRPLPRSFVAGDRARVCLVFLAPGRARVEAMVFAPVEDYEPITWTGRVVRIGTRPRPTRTMGACPPSCPP